MTSRGHQSLQATIIVTYICVWITYYILVHASSRDVDMRNLNPAILVVMVETIKLVIAAGILIGQKQGLFGAWKYARSTVTLSLLGEYIIIAILFFAYNNLMVINLRYFDPTTYLVLASTRLPMTAFAWQLIFSKDIPRAQIIALLIVTVGILVKESPKLLPKDAVAEENPNALSSVESEESAYLSHLSLVMFQMICSVGASVYNEAVLKKRRSVDTQLQNVCLYLESIVINVGAIAMTQSTVDLDTAKVTMVSSMVPMAIVLTLATAGIITSLLLKHVDSVTKSVASASEAAITAVVGSMLFGDPLTPHVVASVALVGVGAYLYACSSGTSKPEKGNKPCEIPTAYRNTIVVVFSTMVVIAVLKGMHLRAPRQVVQNLATTHWLRRPARLEAEGVTFY